MLNKSCLMTFSKIHFISIISDSSHPLKLLILHPEPKMCSNEVLIPLHASHPLVAAASTLTDSAFNLIDNTVLETKLSPNPRYIYFRTFNLVTFII